MISELVELGMPGKVENFVGKNDIPWTSMVTSGLRFPADFSKIFQAKLVCIIVCNFLHTHYPHKICIPVISSRRSLRALLRLLVIALIQSGFGLVFLMAGVVCSTWVAVNVGTSKRSLLAPSGDISSLATRKGNIQISRTWWSYRPPKKCGTMIGDNMGQLFETTKDCWAHEMV